jgi:cytochrome P450
MTLEYRPDDPQFLADPFPLYRRMQDEDPCHWSPRLKAWVLTRYEDVRSVCLDGGMSSDRLRPYFATLPPEEARRVAEIMKYLSLWMVFRDAPEHTRLRRLTSKVFHVKSMHAMRPRIEALMHWLMDAIGDRAAFDLVGDFAGPLPALVIMDMLGVPRAQLGRVHRQRAHVPGEVRHRRSGDARDGDVVPRRDRRAARAAAARPALGAGASGGRR